MITPKIKALFQFIEYLHSNIENFNQYNGLIKDLDALKNQKNKLKSKQNYKDKLQYDKVQAELESKFETLQENTANLIKNKATELNICDLNKTETLWNWNISEINKLKENFSNKDLAVIFKHKNKYLKYRSQTHGTFLSLQFFFNDLDEIAKSLFDYFKDTDQNEFEAFETKTIPVKNLREAIELLRTGEMNVQQKIYYYTKLKCNIPFNELHNTIVTVCQFVSPVFPSVDPLKYFEFFFDKIDFDKIEYNANKKETLNYCNSIYYGLEQLLKADIDKAILDFQNNISNLSKEQINKTQSELIVLLGNLKRQSRTNKAGISFTERYNSLYESIKTKSKLLPIDYQILIRNFNETTLNDLISSYEIITDTFKNITPLKNDLPPQQSQKPKPEPKEINLSEKIKKHFGFMLGNCPRKGTPILNNEKDFDNLVIWTTYFFDNNFEVPEISEPIKSVNTNDYFTQLAFLYLFDELRKLGYHNQRTRAKTLFNLWLSCFADYKGYSEKNFNKVSHKNGKEVKKLMLIDQ